MHYNAKKLVKWGIIKEKIQLMDYGTFTVITWER